MVEVKIRAIRPYNQNIAIEPMHKRELPLPSAAAPACKPTMRPYQGQHDQHERDLTDFRTPTLKKQQGPGSSRGSIRGRPARRQIQCRAQSETRKRLSRGGGPVNVFLAALVADIRPLRNDAEGRSLRSEPLGYAKQSKPAAASDRLMSIVNAVMVLTSFQPPFDDPDQPEHEQQMIKPRAEYGPMP